MGRLAGHAVPAGRCPGLVASKVRCRPAVTKAWPGPAFLAAAGVS